MKLILKRYGLRNGSAIKRSVSEKYKEDVMKSNINIVPVPNELKLKPGAFKLDPGTAVENKSGVTDGLGEFIKDFCGIKSGKSSKSIKIELSGKNTCEEAYSLKISPDSVMITASAPAGIFYGVQTLKQIIAGAAKKKAASVALPCLEINDKPRFAWRGFMLDSSRHFQSVEFIKRLIDSLALCKINRLHWHFIDNHSWRFKSEKYPQLSKFVRGISNDEGSYTVKQVKDIISYAAERFITVYPELEMPGHSQVALSIMPELKCPNISDNTIAREYCLGLPATEKFHKEMIKEVAAIFPAPYLHIGGDEASDANWKFCPRCTAAMKKKKLDSTAMLQKDFMNRMSDFVRSTGKTPVAWAEKLSLGIAEGQIVQGWHEGESLEAARKGFYTVNSEHSFVYFDYPQDGKEHKAWWMPQLPVEKTYSFDPVPAGLSAKQQKLVIGSEACIWTEDIPEKEVFPRTFPRMWAFAETVWSDKKLLDFKSFKKRISAQVSIFEKSGNDLFKG